MKRDTLLAMTTKEQPTPNKNLKVYSFPEYGFSVEAVDLKEALELAEKKRKDNE